MAIIPPNDFITKLMGVLGLPKGTVNFTLHVRFEEPVVVECEYYPSPGEDTITERFNLVRIDDGQGA